MGDEIAVEEKTLIAQVKFWGEHGMDATGQTKIIKYLCQGSIESEHQDHADDAADSTQVQR
jgi:hypothetical protein